LTHTITYNNKQAMLVLAHDITKQQELQYQLVEEKVLHQKEIAKATIDVQEKQRNDIGKELHDNVNQILTSAKLYVECIKPESAEEYGATAAKLINLAVEEIRLLSRSFVPPSLQDTGLILSVEDILHNIEVTKAVQYDFNYSNFKEEDLDDGLKLTLYRIIQEQTTNILKYAHASHIKIELSRQNDLLSLQITDNGKGFDTASHRRGVGISNMINRADIYNGTLSIDSFPGKGCILYVDFKLKNRL
jgi:signal transduction histidine kinase